MCHRVQNVRPRSLAKVTEHKAKTATIEKAICPNCFYNMLVENDSVRQCDMILAPIT